MDHERDRLGEIDRLFEEALELEGAERAVFLGEIRSRDRELAEEIEELLVLGGEEDERLSPTKILDGPLWSELDDAAGGQGLPGPAAGDDVGPYRILRQLGQGGMAVVYLAERVEGSFDQEVALKLLRPGAVAEDSLRRFEQERQILAGLNHPAIARLLDGGVDGAGRPFIALEYVAGEPIDTYCDKHHLSVEQRLDLFTEVARGVSYAHRKLVVHRDLKPSNILVNADGEAKLLDFGIAKLLDPTAAGAFAAPATRTFHRVLTPEYASPEQVRGEPVSTASDVYQLGLLLFELLTGERAYRISGTSAVEIIRVICGEEPRRPSMVTVDDRIARFRRTTVAQLRRRLKGDLDNILLKALRKEPERRYDSPAELVDDLERHRAGLPVRARADTLRYRSRKFIGRHRFGLAAVAALILLVLGYVYTVTAQARQIRIQGERAQAEAAKAREVKDFLIGMFQVSDPSKALGEEISAREVLDQGSERILEELEGQPEIQAEILGAVGEIYRTLGLYDRSLPLLQQAVELSEGPASNSSPTRRENLVLLARTLRDLGDNEGAEALLRQAVALYRQAEPQDPAKLAESLQDLALVLRPLSKIEEAEASLEEALGIYRSLHGEEHEDVAAALNTLGTLAHRQGDLPRSEALFRQVLEIRRRILPPNHPDMATTLSNLALAHRLQARPREAIPLFRESAGIYKEVLGEEHPWTAIPLSNLAQAQVDLGQGEEAEATLKQAFEIRRAHLPENHPEIAANYSDLGRAFHVQGRYEEALEAFRDALRIYPADHPWRPIAESHLATTLVEVGDLSRAEGIFRRVLAQRRETLGDDHASLALDLLKLGSLLHRRGSYEEAEPLLKESLLRSRERYPQGHPWIGRALLALGSLQLADGEPGSGCPHLEEALEIFQAKSDGRWTRDTEAALEQCP